ncbi:MAG: ribosome silencing factor [Oscillospiraceae bacterium]|nr:ribosome silencing factor [Oscillospiraceae bacterium]
MNNLAEKIVKILEDRKATDVKMIDVKDVTTIADYFVIASGNSNLQVRALCDIIEEELEKDNIKPKHIEGRDGATWILMDYLDVVVHIFYYETRNEYTIEDMWTKAPRLD